MFGQVVEMKSCRHDQNDPLKSDAAKMERQTEHVTFDSLGSSVFEIRKCKRCGCQLVIPIRPTTGDVEWD